MSRGRLAPSPTGELHLGGAATFLVAWLEARRREAPLLLRIEDVDTARATQAFADAIMGDLRWLGLGWDEGPTYQSTRSARYEEVLADLAARGLTYLCDCSRAEIARVASAPHEGEEGPRYPGTCARFGMIDRPFRRPPALRFAVPEGRFSFVDLLLGERDEDVALTVGDFVLRRGDGVYAYQLAVTVDDADAGVDHVVRGGDLLSSTGRQVALLRAMGAPSPTYLHTPLLTMPDGTRLAKRTEGLAVRAHRDAGTSPERLLGGLAHLLGLWPHDEPASLAALQTAYQFRGVRRGVVPLQKSLLNLPATAEIR